MKKNAFASIRSLFGSPKFYINAKKSANMFIKDLSHYLDSKPYRVYRHTSDRKTFKSF